MPQRGSTVGEGKSCPPHGVVCLAGGFGAPERVNSRGGKIVSPNGVVVMTIAVAVIVVVAAVMTVVEGSLVIMVSSCDLRASFDS